MNLFSQIGFTLVLIFLACDVSKGQSQFDSRLDELDLFYYSPVESSYKSFKNGETRYFKYDIKLLSKSDKQEIFVILKSEDKLQNLANTPHIEFTRLIASIATNDQNENIVVKSFSEEKLEAYNAAWASEANFILKNNISKYRKAKLISIYKEGNGLASILYCYNEIPDLIQILSFRNNQ